MDVKAFRIIHNPSQTNLEVVFSADNRDPFSWTEKQKNSKG